MRITIALALVFIALLLVGRFLLFSTPLDEAKAAAPSGSIAQDTSQKEPVAQVIQKVAPKGAQSPEIVSNVWLNSSRLATQDLRGKVVVVEFWTHG